MCLFHLVDQNVTCLCNRRSRETKCTYYFKPDNDSFHLVALVQHLEPGESKGSITYHLLVEKTALRLFFKDLLDISGITRKSITSEGVLISILSNIRSQISALTPSGSEFQPALDDLWAVLVTHSTPGSNEDMQQYSLLTMPEFIQVSTYTNDETI